MSRFQPIEFSQAQDDVKSVYADYLATTRSFELPNWLKFLGAHRQLAESYWYYTKSILFSGQLPLVLKELVIFVVSVTNGSPYCSTAHAHSVLSLDSSLSFEDLVAIARDFDSVDLPAATKAALTFARKLAIDPVRVTEDDFRSLGESGYGEPEIQELIATVSLANMFNMLAISNAIPLDEGYRAFPLGPDAA